LLRKLDGGEDAERFIEEVRGVVELRLASPYSLIRSSDEAQDRGARARRAG